MFRQRTAHGAGVFRKREQMQHVDELVFVSLRAVLHGLQVARRRVLNPPRAFLVLRERRHRGTRGVRLLRKRPVGVRLQK